MAHILYGVCGEGFGHSSRAKEIIRHLKKKGHEIKVITYGKGLEALADEFDVKEIFGMRFVYEKNKLKYFESFFKNLAGFPEAVKSVSEVSKMVDRLKIQFVFTDFEPISCIVAGLKKLPLISIDNQHILTNTELKYPKEYRAEANIAKLITGWMVPNAKIYLAISFFEAKVKDNKTFLFPPILRKEVFKAKPKEKDFILVYFTSRFDEIINMLKNINKRFVCYGLNKKAKMGNVILEKNSSQGFLRDLAKCQGVIASAGFSLITEALYLGKPYLAWPIKGQFEQILNGYMLEKLGYGKYWDELNKEKIESFLYNIDSYKEKLKTYPKENNSKILTKIDQLLS